MIITIAGNEVNYQSRSIDIDDAIGSRSIASFNVIDEIGVQRFNKGQIVEMFEDDWITKVFSGVIDTPVSSNFNEYSLARIHKITCCDWHYLADKRIVARLYTGQTAGSIVTDILNNYLVSEGVTPGTIQEGPVITEAVFNYISVTRCFERLAELAGYEWYIDENKSLHFLHRATNYNNTPITETSDISNVTVEPTAEDYRNKQYVRAGYDTTDVQTQSFKGDGTQKTFTVGYPLAKVPTVKVNGVEQTRGIRGVEEGKQWYWSKGDRTISQADGATPLSSSQTLTIEYQGLFDIVAVSYDGNEIERVKAIEGGTGIHEDVHDDPYLTSKEAAFESAGAKLQRYARVGTKVKFNTRITGLRAGHLIHVTLDSYGIDDYFLIESVRANEWGTHDGKLTYQVTVVDGSATGGWGKYFKQLETRGQAYVLRENIQENEVLTLLEQFSKTWISTEIPNIFTLLQPSANTQPGVNTFPSFEVKDRVKYLVFYNASNNEVFRKPITKRVDSSGQIVSTTYISPFEANGVQITNVAWFGGHKATSNSGTGVLVDKQPYSKLKTTMESIQIDKTDLKGW